jgi:hypothetical protein
VVAVRRLAVALAAGVAAAVTAHAAHAAPHLFRPNPVLSTPTPDYVASIAAPGGGPAVLAPLSPAVTAQAVADQQLLHFIRTDDLGGFNPAPVGDSALAGGGRTVVGAAAGKPQIPHYAQAVGGKIQSFAATGLGPVTPSPDNGTQPVPGLGVPSVTPPPTGTNTVPPPNQGFGGQPAGVGGGPVGGETTTGAATTTGASATTGQATTAPTTTTRATTTRPGTTTTRTTTTTPTTTAPPPPTTTTTPTTTTAPTTTSVPPTTTSGGGGSPGSGGTPPSGPSCGTAGLTITSDLASCRIVALNMAPGGAATEHMTIRNDSGGTIDLSLQALGTQNLLWSSLRLGVWEQGAAAPDPLPPLLWWTGQLNRLTTLAAGASVTYVIQLYLPPSAGNAVQDKTAVIDLRWHAQGR